MSELEAKSRAKFTFLGKLAEFWHLQGNPLRRLPTVHGRSLDLYALHKEVKRRGGPNAIEEKDCAHKATRALNAVHPGCSREPLSLDRGSKAGAGGGGGGG